MGIFDGCGEILIGSLNGCSIFPIAPYFKSCISQTDLDELHIELIRNALYKVSPMADTPNRPSTVSYFRHTWKTSISFVKVWIVQLVRSWKPFFNLKLTDVPS